MTVGMCAFLPHSLGQPRLAWLTTWLLSALCLLGWTTVSVAGPTVLYSFSAPQFPENLPVTNSDGLSPGSAMILGSDGNLYGTTLRGGASGAGTIFRLSLPGGLANLYSFPPATNASGEVAYDLVPNGLVEGADGFLYGTTRRGGSNFTGTIFELSLSGSFTNLHTFAALTNNSSSYGTSADGATPSGALAKGSDGNFYGTTQYGGAYGAGTIFRITPSGAFTSLYSFSPSAAGSVSTNGAVPNALVVASNGVFYGTTQQGGVGNAGTFFQFTVAGQFNQIYSFDGDAPGSNPVTPNSALAQGANGYFYGTSAYGGSQGGGSVFVITNTGGATLLHSFPLLNAGAAAALTLGSDGNFYGTTATNGFNGNGTLFRITPTGGFGSYSFASLSANAENAGGADPSASLLADGMGNLYGSCAAGGTNGSGLIFQILETNFIPPFFLPTTNPAPALTNVLVGASVTLSNAAQGAAPFTYQWLKNGTNLADGGDIQGSLTNALVINPVLPGDVGSYLLVISNIWGAVTSSVTVLTVDTPHIAISSPLPNARTNSPVFAGTATNAPVTNNYAGNTQLTNVIFSITNLLNGSNITGVAAVTTGSGGASNWSFTAIPFPGSNILSVQSVDVSGNISPIVSRSFFYEVPAPLTIITTGSGSGTFTFTNGEMLDLGSTYSITATPRSSTFNNWTIGAIISSDPTVQFLMQSNLVLTANFMARQTPAVLISSPKARARTSASVFEGTATSAPVLPGVNPSNVILTGVVYWLTNIPTASVMSGTATLTSGTTTSNWSIAVTPSPGNNILAVQSQDISGGLSRIASTEFFYEAPSLFTLQKAGSGNGTFTAKAQVAGDVPPTNGAMLNLTESYTITAKPDPFSVFSQWQTSSGQSSAPTLAFVMAPGFEATATFAARTPVVTISSPAANLRTASPVFNGTASSHLGIASVDYSLANTLSGATASGSATLTAASGTISNWSITVVPLPGTNILTVTSQDSAGDSSATASRVFFFKVPAQVQILQAGTGSGTFKGAASIPGDIPPTNGALLNIGEKYTITATPGKSSFFSNWVSAAGATTTPVLSFLMQSNLVLTATFISNFFPEVAGTYNGLFFPEGAVAVQDSGMVYNLVLRNTGAASGSLLIAGKRYPFSGNFEVSGNASFKAGPLQVALTLDNASLQITGTVSTSQWTANLIANLASSILPSGQYTILFEAATNDSPAGPPGDGYALVTNHAGAVTLSGALADGTSYSQNVPVSGAGDVPVYVTLYTNTARAEPGLLLGWINLTNLQAAAPSNTLTWIKQASSSSGLYTNGFTNFLSSQGALWTNPPAKASPISLTNGQLVISNAGLSLDFTNVSVTNNILTNLGVLPTNFLSGSVNPKTGFLTFTFGNGNAMATNRASGAFLQNTTNAGGFFLTTTNAGAFNLQP